MAKKFFTISSLLIIASMLLAACGGAAPTEKAASQPEVLRVWIQWGDNPQQIQTLFDKYTAKTGIKVEVTAPLEEDKILPALTGSEPPDVLVLSGGDLVKSYAKEGLVTELSDAIKTGNIDLNDFFAAPLKANARMATRSCACPGARICMPCSGTRICSKQQDSIPKCRPRPWRSWPSSPINSPRPTRMAT